MAQSNHVTSMTCRRAVQAARTGSGAGCTAPKGGATAITAFSAPWHRSLGGESMRPHVPELVHPVAGDAVEDGLRRGRLEHGLFAAPEEAQGERQRPEHCHHRQRDLNAEQPLASPVDVLELEQQPHPGSEGHGQPGLKPLVAGDNRRGARRERDHDAGHEVVDVPAPDPNVAEGTDGRSPPKRERDRAHQDEGGGERREQVEHRVLPRRDLSVTRARDPCRLRNRLLRREERVIGVPQGGCRAEPPCPSHLDDDHRYHRTRGERAEHQRASARCKRLPPPHDTTRAGTPITRAPGGTSRVTTAPAATNASSPISTPGSRTAAAPTRQARLSVAPRSSTSGARRPAVGSLVSMTPGARNTSSSTIDHAVTYAPDCIRTRAPICTSFSTEAPRPTTDSSPIVERSRT